MKYFMLALTIFVTSCGKQPTTTVPSPLACTVSQSTNGATIHCPDGSSQTLTNGSGGATGASGGVGAQGATGTQGLTGLTGQNGTPVTPVQFCTGYTTTYPTTFAEDGLCINGSVYAVYWNGEAALTMIPPGSYSSTSTTAPCNFTVGANCAVSN